MKLSNEQTKEIVKSVLAALSNKKISQSDVAIDELDNKFFEELGSDLGNKIQDVEDLLREKMEQGFNINIECKGKGRTYEMSYEGTATEVGKHMWDTGFQYRHTVGDTLSEFVFNLFNKPVTKHEGLEDLLDWNSQIDEAGGIKAMDTLLKSDE